MKWIILIGNENFSLGMISNIEHYGCIYMDYVSENRLVVDYGKEHIFYDYVEDLINDYEEEEHLCIPFPNSKFIMVVYTSEQLLKKVLTQDNYLKGIYVDDDYGNILPLEEFIMNFENFKNIT